MSTADPYLIAGGGHAARRAAETLRERDPAARIVMIGAEPELPYDRPVLSKEALVGGDAGERRAFVRDAAWYREARSRTSATCSPPRKAASTRTAAARGG
ncbi:FAD-dependent oxidoreductase, partial [Burkholderia pseudomallei]